MREYGEFQENMALCEGGLPVPITEHKISPINIIIDALVPLYIVFPTDRNTHTYGICQGTILRNVIEFR